MGFSAFQKNPKIIPQIRKSFEQPQKGRFATLLSLLLENGA